MHKESMYLVSGGRTTLYMHIAHSTGPKARLVDGRMSWGSRAGWLLRRPRSLRSAGFNCRPGGLGFYQRRAVGRLTGWLGSSFPAAPLPDYA
jgi:hypothetical protein